MRALAFALLVCVGACADRSGAEPGTPRPETAAVPDKAAAEPAAPEPAAPGVELAAAPAIDLVGNRYLWHVHAQGLVLPLASEGVRKYTQEYSRPWRALVEHEGRAGRVLSRRQATLTFPWWDEPGAATAVLRAAGLSAGQRVSLRLNGRSLGTVSLEPGWQSASVSVPAGALRRGENELVVHVGKAASAGGERSYALWHSIEIAPAGADVGTELPALSPAATREDAPVLTGFSRLVQLVEVPEAAWLEFGAAAAEGARLSITATPAGGGDPVELWAGGASPTRHISLETLAGQLVALELRSSDPSAAWVAPRIALAKTAPRPAPAPAKNVILLVVDALRSDKLPLYEAVYGDGHAVRMPHLEAAAKKGSVVFLHNQAASPSSPPSHGSIQTGMIPRVHGVAGDTGRIEPGTPMLSTQLVDAGIAAGYFGNNPFGMGRLEEPGRWTAFHQPGQEGKSNDCTALMEMMLEFARAQSASGQRFFISSLPYETHTPYRYHEGITEHYYDGDFGPPVGKSVDGHLLGALSDGRTTLTETQWKQLRGLYDGEAEYMDQCFGQLVAGLDEAGLLADTAIVLTSDHGEGMFEHGKMGHAFGHYRELGDVPFVILWPALADGVVAIDTVTTHRDLTPTILDMMGVTPDEKVQGMSVLPLATREGPWTPRVVSLEYGRSYALRSRRYKMIVGYGGEEEFYDLVADPWEKDDIRATRPLAVRYLRDLAGFFLEHRSDWRMPTWGMLNDHEQGFLERVEGP